MPKIVTTDTYDFHIDYLPDCGIAFKLKIFNDNFIGFIPKTDIELYKELIKFSRKEHTILAGINADMIKIHILDKNRVFEKKLYKM